SKRIWAVPALMLVALVGYLLWPGGVEAPRYQPRPDRTTRRDDGERPRPPTPPPAKVADTEVVPTPQVPVAPPVPPEVVAKQHRPAAATGKLRLSSEPWANVAIDGRPITKPTPLVDYPIASGTRVVTLSHPGFRTERRIVRIIPGETALLRVVLER